MNNLKMRTKLLREYFLCVSNLYQINFRFIPIDVVEFVLLTYFHQIRSHKLNLICMLYVFIQVRRLSGHTQSPPQTWNLRDDDNKRIIRIPLLDFATLSSQYDESSLLNKNSDRCAFAVLHENDDMPPTSIMVFLSGAICCDCLYMS